MTLAVGSTWHYNGSVPTWWPSAEPAGTVVNQRLLRSCIYPTKVQEHRLKVKEYKGFSAEWSKFIILNRSEETFTHDYDIVIGPVADAFVDKKIERHKQKYGAHYLDTEALLDFAEHVSQFGSKYVQYCFCTKEALKELIKE